MQNRIAREVFFEQSALASSRRDAIQEAIQAAILFYENELFWFNEQQATTDTEAGYEYYPAPTDYIQMYSLALRKSADAWETLEAKSFDEIEQSNRGSGTGRPHSYCSFNQQFRLSPVPNASYQLRLSYLKKLAALALDEDSNAWMTEAEPMIRAKAKAILLLDAVHDIETAAQHDVVSDMWFKRLQKRTLQYIGTQQIRLQEF